MTPAAAVLIAGSFEPVDTVLIAVVVILLVLCAGLALAETALVRTSRAKAIALEEEGHHGAHLLRRLADNPEGFLNAILLMVLISQLVTATLVGLLASKWFGAWGVAVATVFEVIVIFVFAEAIPKNWAVRNVERAALLAAPLVSVVVGFPPVRMLSSVLVKVADRVGGGGGRETTVSESELLAMADVATEEEVIEHDERRLIHSIIDFGDTVVREVMVPRPVMRTVDARQTVADALDVAITAGYSRLPAYSDNVDDVVGLAYVKDLIRVERDGHGQDPVVSHLRTARFVPETKRVANLMREMQADKYHLAIVVDEYGGTAGLVTLEDLIEELVGEIVDEFDTEETPVQRLPAGDVSVMARLSVDEVNELLDAHLPTGGWDTVGGLVFNMLGHVPAVGEGVDVDGVRLTVERVDGNRIGRVRISPSSDG